MKLGRKKGMEGRKLGRKEGRKPKKKAKEGRRRKLGWKKKS